MQPCHTREGIELKEQRKTTHRPTSAADCLDILVEGISKRCYVHATLQYRMIQRVWIDSRLQGGKGWPTFFRPGRLV